MAFDAIQALETSIEQKMESKEIVSNVGLADFHSFESNALAHSITNIDVNFLKKIKPGDFVEQIILKNEKKNIQTWINRFNQLSFWVGPEICTTPKLEDRIKVVEGFIKLLKCLKELQNYNGVMAIVSGLNSASVRRLKKTWAVRKHCY
jgi:hypothetical protein